MAASDTDLQSCDTCGATVYPEHLERHAAERVSGKLYCAHCLQAQRSGANPANPPIALGDDAGGESRVLASAAVSTVRDRAVAQHRTPTYQRPLTPESPYATRCKTFHCKLTDASIAHLDEQVNEWVDQHTDVVVKFATSTVGTVEGKHHDPHLIVTIYY